MSPVLYLLFHLRMTQTYPFISGDDPNDLVNTMNNEMIRVIDWLRVNKLNLNTDKTHFVFFRRQRKPVNTIVNNQWATYCTSKINEFLGIIIDESLQWGKHTKYLKENLQRNRNIMEAIFVLCILVSTFILLYWRMGKHLQWTPWSLREMIERALRLISGSNRRAYTTLLFENLEILTLRNFYVYFIQIFMYKCHQKLLPRNFLIILLPITMPMIRIRGKCDIYRVPTIDHITLNT